MHGSHRTLTDLQLAARVALEIQTGLGLVALSVRSCVMREFEAKSGRCFLEYVDSGVVYGIGQCNEEDALIECIIKLNIFAFFHCDAPTKGSWCKIKRECINSKLWCFYISIILLSTGRKLAAQTGVVLYSRVAIHIRS
ncbi:hypothetical protein M758_7G183900 [Ceratodon purpureus]|nr:hypothetical protein M758_7G183900 [Ceratodon purpureus]